MKASLLKRIKSKNITIGVVGLGYVGLPLAVEKALVGFKTIGFDIQDVKVDKVNKGENYIGDIIDSDLSKAVDSGLLKATNDFSFIKNVDFVALCVPTPLDAYQQPDISYVRDSAKEVAKYLKKGAMIVLESTTYPGTTEELLKPILEEGSGMKCGEDFYLGFSPERVDPGNKQFKTKNTPKVVGAIGEDAKEIISEVYRQVLEGDVFVTSTPAVAEMTKILENTYRNINIGLANEMAILSERMGINYWEVVEAAKTKPFGFQAFYPGPGLGGHCIPLDPYYLSWKAREFGFHTSMIEASMMVNDRMPEYCVERVSKVLNKYKKSINGSKILVLGVAYKNNIDDYRESPILKIIDILDSMGANIEFYDPYINEYKYKNIKKTGLKDLSTSHLNSADLIFIGANHSSFDYDLVQKNAEVIFDAKNATADLFDKSNIEVL
ncbi:nucleotide sugar dehydrogenase [Francisella uliginis]|uniref:UDP-N-acetyl-D-glucosamine dehydrogenase n=1 Tax=Francisella uliginis TaxID=573570 RepID=A0A1L4BTA5_9GAMM|nr:nucleotide sugar dehydrogenase [Francisella uliginis]API87080.1 UDP-N-acetyl-D-glucosamine dehydrogenase [Francisella uliginis]